MTHLTVGQVAKRWGVRVQQVLVLIHADELPAINLSRPGAKRPTWRIRTEDLDRFERKANTIPAPLPATKRRKSAPVREYIR